MCSETTIATRRLFDRFPFLAEKQFLSFNINARSQIQQGPTCGLVALSIAASAILGQPMISPGFVTEGDVTPLLHLAQKLQISRQGEIFSVDYITRLATGFYHLNVEVQENMLRNPEEVFTCLLHKWPVLVPYDKDKNNEPCLSNGHSAHWAVLTGFMIPLEQDLSPVLRQSTHLLDESLPVHCLTDSDGQSHCLSTISEWYSPVTSDLSKVYIYARHGRSRHLALWPLDILAESNRNLTELDPRKKVENFVLPQGGLLEGLNSKTVVVKPGDC